MTPIVFDKSYFREVNGYHHPAGYSDYRRISQSFAGLEGDQGELFRTQHYLFYQQYREHLEGKKVLELGSALGYCTEDLRDFGVDISGIDICEWAVGQSAGWCSWADVRLVLPLIADGAYDTIIGLRFLPCFTDTELALIKPHIERIAETSIFVVDDLAVYGNLTGMEEHYNIKTLDEWQALFPNSIIESVSGVKWVAA